MKGSKPSLTAFFLVCLASTTGMAGDTVFVFGKTQVAFMPEPQTRVLIGSSCRAREGVRCEAAAALARVADRRNSVATSRRSGGGASPAAGFCEQGLKAEVVIGRDASWNERSFCKFKDGSLADADGLFAVAKGRAQGAPGSR